MSGKAHRAPFEVLEFYTGVEDPAHVSFVGEANRWFPEIGRAQGFTYHATTDWKRLNADGFRACRWCCSSTHVPKIRQGATHSGITWSTAARGWDFTCTYVRADAVEVPAELGTVSATSSWARGST